MMSCYPLAKPPSWRTTPCQLCVTVYAVPQPEDVPYLGDRDSHTATLQIHVNVLSNLGFDVTF